MLYPIFLKLSGKKCLVIGGGNVAERKVHSLLKSGASVTVNSPDLTSSLQELAGQKKINAITSEFQEEFLEGCFLVIGSTDRPEINKRVADEAERRGILYNIVDDPAQCNFFVPSLVERGDLSIAISTNGKSPSLAKRLRQKLEKEFGEEYEGFLKMMGELRERVVRSGLNLEERGRFFEALVDSDLLDLFRQGKGEEAERKAEEMLKEWIGDRT